MAYDKNIGLASVIGRVAGWCSSWHCHLFFKPVLPPTVKGKPCRLITDSKLPVAAVVSITDWQAPCVSPVIGWQSVLVVPCLLPNVSSDWLQLQGEANGWTDWWIPVSGEYVAVCAHAVLIFCSTAGPQRVQQMFPSVSVLWRAATRGPPQLSKDGHISIYSPILIRNTGIHTALRVLSIYYTSSIKWSVGFWFSFFIDL